MALLTRRSFFLGAGAALAATAPIVRVVKPAPFPEPPVGALAWLQAMQDAERELRMFGVCYFEQTGTTLTHIPIEDVLISAAR